jgi:hypothetical protein
MSVFSVVYTVWSGGQPDILCQTVALVTNSATLFGPGGTFLQGDPASAARGTATPPNTLIRAHQALAQPVDELAILLRQVMEEAIDRFDDHAPLGEPGDGAQRIEACLEFVRHTDAELWIVLDLLSFFRASGRSAYASAFGNSSVGHGRGRWRSTAEMRTFRCASDSCEIWRVNASGNVMPINRARRDPARVRRGYSAALAQHTQIENERRRCQRSRSGAAENRASRQPAAVAVRLHSRGDVPEATVATTDRRRVQNDRRRHSRSGRRASDPHLRWHWRRLAWLFAAYAVYLSVRSLPTTLKKRFQRTAAA